MLKELPTDAAIRHHLQDWNPEARAAHCTNCCYAKVSGDPAEPVVQCAQGWGTGPLKLWLMTRARAPRQFAVAARCPNYRSMSDAE